MGSRSTGPQVFHGAKARMFQVDGAQQTHQKRQTLAALNENTKLFESKLANFERFVSQKKQTTKQNQQRLQWTAEFQRLKNERDSLERDVDQLMDSFHLIGGDSDTETEPSQNTGTDIELRTFAELSSITELNGLMAADRLLLHQRLLQPITELRSRIGKRKAPTASSSLATPTTRAKSSPAYLRSVTRTRQTSAGHSQNRILSASKLRANSAQTTAMENQSETFITASESTSANQTSDKKDTAIDNQTSVNCTSTKNSEYAESFTAELQIQRRRIIDSLTELDTTEKELWSRIVAYSAMIDDDFGDDLELNSNDNDGEEALEIDGRFYDSKTGLLKLSADVSRIVPKRPLEDAAIRDQYLQTLFQLEAAYEDSIAETKAQLVSDADVTADDNSGLAENDSAANGCPSQPRQWTASERFRFVKLMDEFGADSFQSPALGTAGPNRRRELFFDRVALEMPHIHRLDVIDFEARIQRRKLLKRRMKALQFDFQYKRTQIIEEMFQSLLMSARLREIETMRAEEREALYEQRMREHEQLETLRAEKQQKDRIAEERRRERDRIRQIHEQKQLQQREKERKEMKERLGAYQHEQRQRRQRLQAIRAERMADESAEAAEQRRLNAERAQFRSEERSARIADRKQREIQIQRQREARANQLEELRETVRAQFAHIGRDSERLRRQTESSSSAAASNNVDWFPIHGYTDGEVLSDLRLRLQIALQKANLSNSEYGRRLLLHHIPPPRRPRPDMIGSSAAFFRGDTD